MLGFESLSEVSISELPSTGGANLSGDAIAVATSIAALTTNIEITANVFCVAVSTADLTAISAIASSKLGGDDVPRREYWETRKKPKKRDEELETTLREAFRKATGIEDVQEIIATVAPTFDDKAWLIEQQRIIAQRLQDEDDEEVLLLLL